MADARAERARRRAARQATAQGATTATTTAAPPAARKNEPAPWPDKRWYRRPLFLPIEDWGARTIFKFSLGYLVLLLVLPAAYSSDLWGFKGHITDPVAGLIPIGVPYAGALGAVTIGLYGVFEHNKRWDPSFNYWHLTRPLMGALLGSVGYLIFVATIQSTGVTPAVEASKGATQPRDLIIYYVIGFVVGYREETFRELVKRAADVIFKPGGSGQSRMALVVDKPVGDCPHTVVLTPTVAASITEWKLDFGDSDGVNGQGAPPASAHTYTRPGIYLATLEVTENTGGTSAATAQVTVTGNAVPPSSAAALADPGVQRIERAATDADKQKIERELVTNTDKFVEAPASEPDADHP
ncbi:MAG: hypothetical protein QOF60_2902 [Actinomycetota bacterium]|jgi:hypothetical protein|nr:hypothetical protein [Actinomycetota bacterium]